MASITPTPSPRHLRVSEDLLREVLLKEVGLSRFTHMATITTGLGILAFLIWAAHATLNEVAVTRGQVAPKSTVHIVQHLEGGIVSEILVREGDEVTAGQTLVVFDGVATRAEMEKIQHRLIVLVLRAERLRAFAQDRRAFFHVVPAKLATIRQEEIATLEWQRADLLQQRALMEQSRQVRIAEIKTLEKQLEAEREKKEYAQHEVNMFEELIKRKHSSELKLLRSKHRLAETKLEIARLLGRIKELQEGLEELRHQADSYKTSVRKQALVELSEINADIAEVRQSIIAYEDKVARLTVRAPVSGMVQFVAAGDHGMVVAPGAGLVEIVPLDEPLVLEARLSPQDIGFVHPGLSVEVKIDAFDFTRYGTVPGTVVRISPSTLVDELGVPYYKAIIDLEKRYVGDNPKDNPLRPGMTAEADILTGQKTVLQYFLKPVFVSFSEGLRER